METKLEKENFHGRLQKEFEWFHEHPELSYEEVETTKHLRRLLEEQGIEILELPLKTGLTAIIRGKYPGPVIAIRSDIDALPVEEDTQLAWSSREKGTMQACGHDFHMTALYGAAILLKEKEAELHGTIKLIFQPAEESSLGALEILRTGVLSDVEAIFGIHSSSEFPVGTLGIREGSVTAAVDRFELEIQGFGTHAAHPHQGKDPVVAASALVGTLQTIVSRNLDPFSAGLISVTHISAGNTWNVIPENAFLEGTVRTLKEEDRVLIERRLKEASEYTAKAYGMEASVRWIAGPPATKNDKRWVEFARRTAAQTGLETAVTTPSLGGEDFAFYQENTEGVFIQVGTGRTYPNHHPKFQVDPKALQSTAEYLSVFGENALLEILKRGEKHDKD